MSHGSAPIPPTVATAGRSQPLEPADSVEPATLSPAARRRWDDVTLRTKVTLLVMLATVWGTVIGIGFAVLFDGPVWMALGAVGLLVLVLMVLADQWVHRPLDELVSQAARMCLPDRPLPAGELPTDRWDEIGQLARALQRLSLSSRRDYSQARQLRRTLDQRVSQATRRATSQLMRLVMRDPLTQLGNRRFFDEQFPALFDSCRQAGQDLACVVIDLDGFKQINDTLGHFVGDELLQFIGGLIRSQIRNDDLAARYGGDEFVMLLPGVSPRRCGDLLEYLNDLLVAHGRAVLPREVNIGLSAGVAWRVGDRPDSAEQMFQIADRRLYHAKRQGKGRVVFDD